jgi:aldose sugar dehydrogenase
MRASIATGAACLILTSLWPLQSAIASAETERKSGEATSQVCKPSEYAADTYFPKPAFAGQTRARAGVSRVTYRVERVATGLAHPWSLAFLPDGRMLVTEKPGRLRIVSLAGELGPPLEGVPMLAKFPDGDGGIHDVLLDPQFAANRIVYFTTYEIVPGQKIELDNPDQPLKGIGRVMRARLSADERRLEDMRAVYDGIGGARRLAYARDGTLLVTTFAIDEEPAQRLDTNESKVLRIRTDGSIPADNPWRGKSGSKPELYAIGIRDSEGLALDRASGAMWEVEHGPRGGDELNLIRAAKNYGYAAISYGREYSGELINGGLTAKKGMEQPVYFWTPSIAPSGLLVYRGEMFPEWQGDIFLGALAARRLVHLEMKNSRVASEDFLLTEQCWRIRDVRQGPRGEIYLLTDEDPGDIVRIVRQVPR